MIRETLHCDEPGCPFTAEMTAASLRALHRAGWRGYWQGDRLRHHCPAHPVETETEPLYGMETLLAEAEQHAPPTAPGGVLSRQEIADAAEALGHFLNRSRPLAGLSSHMAERVGNVRRVLTRCPHGARLEALPSDDELAEAVMSRHVGVLPEPDLQSEGLLRSLPPAEERAHDRDVDCS